MTDGFEAFDREMAQNEEKVIAGMVAAYIDLVADTYADLVIRSPVRTGAYRAEHVVGIGSGETIATILYENPERVGPYHEHLGTPIPADPTGPRGSLDDLSTFPPVVILNQRFYAPMLEYGTASMEPRRIYEMARQRAEARGLRVEGFDGTF